MWRTPTGFESPPACVCRDAYLIVTITQELRDDFCRNKSYPSFFIALKDITMNHKLLDETVELLQLPIRLPTCGIPTPTFPLVTVLSAKIRHDIFLL